MKRLYQIVAAAIVTLFVPLIASTPTLAASCDIGFTGPDSSNMCTSVEKYQCEVTNTNTVEIKNSSNQVVASGAVNVSGNGTGGTATSGSVTNTNGASFTVTITNAIPTVQDSGTCTAAVVVPATEEPVTPTPVTTVTPEKTDTPKALPVTSGDATLPVTAAIAGGAALAAVLSVAAVLLYRRAQNL